MFDMVRMDDEIGQIAQPADYATRTDYVAHALNWDGEIIKQATGLTLEQAQTFGLDLFDDETFDVVEVFLFCDGELEAVGDWFACLA